MSGEEEVVEREVEMSLIEFLLNCLKCEEDEEGVIGKGEVADLARQAGIDVEEEEFNDLLDVLFNQQQEDMRVAVYQRLVAMVSSEMQREGDEEEGGGEGSNEEDQFPSKEKGNSEEELPEHPEEDNEPKHKEDDEQEDDFHRMSKEQEDRMNRNNPIKEFSNNRIDNKENINSIKKEAEPVYVSSKPLTDLDLLSQNYVFEENRQTKKQSFKLFDNVHLLNQDYAQIEQEEQQNKPFPSKQFETIIQPSNTLHSPLIHLSPNPNSTEPQAKPSQQFNQPPSNSQSSPIKAQMSHNLKPNDDCDYFLQLFKSSKSKSIQLLSDKINKVSDKEYTRTKCRELFSFNSNKGKVNQQRKLNQLSLSKKKRRLNTLEANYALHKSYLKQTIDQNFNDILKGTQQSKITYPFKTKQFNLRNPKEKQLYLMALKNDLKEFSNRKEQIKISRNDAFGDIDFQLEELMKKNHFGLYSLKENNKTNDDHEIVDDQVN